MSDIWDSREADFKPLDVISREFGLKEDKYDNFSLMADQFGEQYAHLLIQHPNDSLADDWIGAFEDFDSLRPTFLFQTSQNYCLESLLHTQELCNPPCDLCIYNRPIVSLAHLPPFPTS